MKIVYPAILHREDGAYWIEFLDLEGCRCFGDTLAEIMDNAKEALAGYCLALIEGQRKLPAASDLDTIERDDGDEIEIIVIETIQKDTVKYNINAVSVGVYLYRAAFCLFPCYG